MKYKMIPTMRWFGAGDGVSLQDIRQAGCEGIVTALHHIPNGEVWEIEEIKKCQDKIRRHHMEWSVVESLPVSEEIKTRSGHYKVLIENYKQSIKNLATCGITTITYNFMPILDWTRTDLGFTLANGAKALRFERQALMIFDLFILKRENAHVDYSDKEVKEAKIRFENLDAKARGRLQDTIIAGLPGSEAGYSIERFRESLRTYNEISAQKLRENVVFFLKEIMPTAEAAGVQMVVHPDDPPYPILGLPRVISTADDLAYIFEQVPSKNNGLCFCTGSLGVISGNDLPAMVRRFGDRIHFLHLRNTKRNAQGDFFEANHLEGDSDMFEIVKEVVQVMSATKRRIPMRPDHGHQMLDDLHKTSNPGYTAIGRLKGLAELRGLEYGIDRFLNHKL